MKLTYKINERAVVEVEVGSQIELFEKLAELDELFASHRPMIQGALVENIRFVVREVDGNKYYEMVTDAEKVKPEYRYYKKQFGKNKSGDTLFPKRHEETNTYWAKWNRETGKMEA